MGNPSRVIFRHGHSSYADNTTRVALVFARRIIPETQGLIGPGKSLSGPEKNSGKENSRRRRRAGFSAFLTFLCPNFFSRPFIKPVFTNTKRSDPSKEVSFTD